MVSTPDSKTVRLHLGIHEPSRSNAAFAVSPLFHTLKIWFSRWRNSKQLAVGAWNCNFPHSTSKRWTELTIYLIYIILHNDIYNYIHIVVDPQRTIPFGDGRNATRARWLSNSTDSILHQRHSVRQRTNIKDLQCEARGICKLVWCGAFHSHRGTPIAGRFVLRKSHGNGWWLGVPHFVKAPFGLLIVSKPTCKWGCHINLTGVIKSGRSTSRCGHPLYWPWSALRETWRYSKICKPDIPNRQYQLMNTNGLFPGQESILDLKSRTCRFSQYDTLVWPYAALQTVTVDDQNP